MYVAGGQVVSIAVESFYFARYDYGRDGIKGFDDGLLQPVVRNGKGRDGVRLTLVVIGHLQALHDNAVVVEAEIRNQDEPRGIL
jgi:hypothetical protein